ncbi:RNA-binding protein [Nocardia sp. GTS18]|uniref:RNA-binding protein n=1 Tax=Nocardia sp. GTS18 TaxID=1778064 RepID=UPI0015EF5775|nr:RNA-binding protein [Nocardia sp. GTS18]
MFYTYRVSKYDPDDRDEHGRYLGAEDTDSDHDVVESAYLRAVAAFAEDAGVDQLAIREPQIAAVDGHGLAGLFPPDLAGFHDGAEVSIAVGLELVRAMLRENGAWCRLEVEDVFTVHVGWDQYVYIGADHACERALSHTHTLGLFAERLTASPYDAVLDDEPGEQRPADDTFWTQLRRHLATDRASILEEGYVVGASRWHRITDGTIDAVRAELTPRSRLTVWPDLSGNVEEVLVGLPAEGLIELIWEDEHGRISSTIADDTGFAELAARVARARAATALSVDMDERFPLFAAVLPDSDGVLRARWRTEAARGDSG